MDEVNVLKALSEERGYQRARWGDTDDSNTVGDFLIYLGRELDKARTVYISPAHDVGSAMAQIRKVTALGVAAMEKFGTGTHR